jgi:chromosome partitioning protein
VTRVIAIMNQYAQAGKTMTTLNLGYALALMNKTVTLIDIDPKAQLSQDCRLGDATMGINQVLKNEVSIVQARHSLADGFGVVPVGEGLMTYEKEGNYNNKMQQSYKLKKMIEAMTEQQDFILIDCPSKSSLLTVNALLAADEIIIPTKIDFASLQGMVQSVSLFKRLKKLSKGAKLWLVLTQLNQTDSMASEIKDSLKAYFPQRVFNTAIRKDNALAESRKNKETIFDYQQQSDAAADYFLLAQDIIEGRVN